MGSLEPRIAWALLVAGVFAVVPGIGTRASVAPMPQDTVQLDELIQTDVTTHTGSKGVMVRPYGPGPYPAVLHLHGSGETVAKSLVVLRILARAGYVSMDIEYPPASSGSVENLDVRDAAASLEFLKASRFVRKNLVGLNGFSRGARAALRLAAIQDVRAVSAIAARSSGGVAPTILDEAERLKAPILLQHGMKDPTVPYQDSVLLERRLKSLGRRVKLVSYRNAGHNDLPWDKVYEQVLRFFDDNLR
jgi:dipeptidyl aminopeptidase/acylaminoacyl peptidase